MRIIFLFLIVFFSSTKTSFSQLNSKNEIITIAVDGKPLLVEIADTSSKRQTGLMFRKKLGENEGILFIFPRTDYLSFWMKNTLIPLSLAYFNEDRRLTELHDMIPQQTREVYNSSEKVIYALEVNQGWFKKNNINRFSVLQLPKVLVGR